jgi:integrase
MAKQTSLSPTFDGTRKRWRLAVPAAYSDTGKRRNMFFDTKRAATMEAERLRSVKGTYGSRAIALPRADIEDASRALEALRNAGHDVTLHSIAQDFIKSETVRRESVTMAKLWEKHTEAKGSKSEAYQKTFSIVAAKVIEPLAKRLVCDVSKSEIEDAIRKGCPTASGFNLVLRTLSPAMNRAVREGWTSENVCKRIESMGTTRKTVSVLTLSQARKLMLSAKDYREDATLPEWLQVDARGATPALALMLFGGVRPAEVGRLEWPDIDMDAGTIFVSNVKSKTDRSRFFNMPDTLREWLELTPEDERHGTVTPANWKKVWQAIRSKVGIKDQRDQCRKTFATAHLGAFQDINLTRSIMGHEVGDVIFQNYRGLMRPKDALAFWKIRPTTNELEATA